MAILGIVGFQFMKGGSSPTTGATPAATEHTTVSDATQPAAAPSAPAVASQAVAAHASGTASRAAPAWQATAQPAVVAGIRTDSLAAYQVQMERWTCEGDKCVGNLRIPPTVEAGRRGDLSAAAKILETLGKEMARSNVDVALQAIHPGPEGLAVNLEFTPFSARKGRFYTDAEITSIRMESFEQGIKSVSPAASR